MTSNSYAVTGFDAAGIAANIKQNGAPDLALIASRLPCRAAGVFTRNAFPAAPVIFDRQLLAFNPENIHAVIINSGCANASTGIQGSVNARLTAGGGGGATGRPRPCCVCHEHRCDRRSVCPWRSS